MANGFKKGRPRIRAGKTRSDQKPKSKSIPDKSQKIGWIFTPAEKQLPTWEETQRKEKGK